MLEPMYRATFADEIDDILDRQQTVAEREQTAAERERTALR